MSTPTLPPLTRYFNGWKKQFPTFAGKAAVLAAVSNNHSLVHRLLPSVYSIDLTQGGANMIPPPTFNEIKVVRDENLNIIAVNDGESEVTGNDLGRLKASFAAYRSGKDSIIWDGEDKLAGLAIPMLDVLKETTVVKKGADMEVEREVVVLAGQQANITRSYLKVKETCEVLAYEGLKLANFPMVLRALNNCWKLNEEFQVPSLKNLEECTAFRKSDVKRTASEMALVDAIEASYYESATVEERINVLEKYPTAEFAAKLHFPRPWTKQLFDSKGVAHKKVALGNLPASEEVLVQDLPMDPGFLKTAFSTDLLVYKSVPGMWEKMRSSKQMRPVKGVTTIKAVHFQRIANSLKSSDVDAKPPAKRSPDTDPTEPQPALKKVRFI